MLFFSGNIFESFTLGIARKHSAYEFLSFSFMKNGKTMFACVKWELGYFKYPSFNNYFPVSTAYTIHTESFLIKFIVHDADWRRSLIKLINVYLPKVQIVL